MAIWNKKKVLPSEVNNGNEFNAGDGVRANDINKIFQSGLYSQDLVENIGIGQVKTSESGGDAQASISYDSSTGYPKLNLTLPRGEKGEQGLVGERGERGEKGDRGEQGIKGDKGDKGEPGSIDNLFVEVFSGEIYDATTHMEYVTLKEHIELNYYYFVEFQSISSDSTYTQEITNIESGYSILTHFSFMRNLGGPYFFANIYFEPHPEISELSYQPDIHIGLSNNETYTPSDMRYYLKIYKINASIISG